MYPSDTNVRKILVEPVVLPNIFQYNFMANQNFVKTAGFCSAGHIYFLTVWEYWLRIAEPKMSSDQF